ncbi:glycosyltransferase family 2 protein [bacterium]|nr:glycosyltransferase family 2 protein [bacterium]
MKLPSVSVIFLAYKQEAYVREALRSVLAQDLADYEVIIGDDASPDATRRIIEEEVAAYQGRAKVILLPAAPNLGIIRNFNRCVAAATGDILVGTFDPRSFHLYQGIQFCGATGSYRAEVHRDFPPIYGVIGGEDGPSIIRSLLLGAAAVDSEILLDWRWHGANVSHGGKPKGLDWRAKLRRSAAWPAGQKVHRRGYLRDIEHAIAQGMVTLEKANRLRSLTDDLHAQASVKLHCTHPNARWSAIGKAIAYFWRVSPRSRPWKLRFLAKTLGKKLLPGPVRAVLLFNFSKF